ncbi:MAG: flippase-like domain-containing protein [Caldilineaceae bacterium]|nr:flippase-like domain-containing protein [Caldilineaceae bacterium]
MDQHPSSLPPFQLPTLHLGPWRLGLLIGLGLLTAGLLIGLGGGRTAITALTTVDLRWLGLALLVHYSGFAVRGLRWQQLLQAMGQRRRWREVTVLLLSGWFVSALLPARAGDLLRIAVLRLPTPQHPPVPVAASTGSIVLERMFDLVALVGLGAGVGFTLLRSAMPGWIVAAYGSTVVLLGLAFGALVVAPPLLQWLRTWSSQARWQQLLDLLSQLIQSLRSLRRAPGLALVVLLESLYIWLCDALLMWAVLQAMGVAAPLSSITFVALTADMFAAIPITPGGIGQVEGVTVALLALLPLPVFNLAAAVLLNRAISYWTFLLFSGVVTFVAGIGPLLFQGPSTPAPPPPAPQE